MVLASTTANEERRGLRSGPGRCPRCSGCGRWRRFDVGELAVPDHRTAGEVDDLYPLGSPDMP